MSDQIVEPAPLSATATLDEVIAWAMATDVWRRAREPVSAGSALSKFVPYEALVDVGVLSYSPGTHGTGEVFDPGDAIGSDPSTAYLSDLTPPPDATGLTGVSLFSGAFLQWDAPIYSQGGGNAYTEIYAANYSGTGPLPTFANAVLVGTASGSSNVYVDAAQLGVERHYWIKFVSHANVRQVNPTGGTNGVTVTIGLVGTSNLGPLIVEAANLANNAVTASKIAAAAVTLTAFAAGITPVEIVTSLPSSGNFDGRTAYLTTDDKLYRYTGGAWSSATAAADITGQLVASQLAVSIGGGNLLSNSSFEDGLNGWSYSGVASSTTQAYRGTKSIALTRASSSVPTCSGPLNIPLAAGDTVTISAWVYLATAMTAEINLYGGPGPTDLARGTADPTKLNQWQRVVKTYTIATAATYQFRVFCDSGIDGTFYADAVQVEIGDVATAYAPRPDEILPGTVGTTQIADDAITTAKLIAGSVVAGKIAANAISATELQAASVVAGKIAANAVTSNELAANSVIAGKIAAAAVNTNELAANAVTTGKLLVTGQGKALNDDPFFLDTSAWTQGGGSGSYVLGTESSSPAGTQILRATNAVQFKARSFAINPGTTYKVAMWANQTSGGGSMYLRLYCYDSSGALVNYVATNLAGGNLEGIDVPNAWTKYTGYVTAGPGAVTGQLIVYVNWSTAGVTDVADCRVEEYIGYDLIVDGSIIASKLAVNAIAVGSAAVENGAINNAMIANLAVDNAKIASLSVSKLTAGSVAVGEYIQSTGFSPGNPGFRLTGSGSVEIRDSGNTRIFDLGASGANPVLQIGSALSILGSGSASFAGDISASSGNFRDRVTGGAITAYAWPPAGSGPGFYLGPNGLLLGNVNDGKFFQVASTGDIYAPNFNIVGGVLTFNGNGTFSGTLTAAAVNAVDTINIAGNAVTVPITGTATGVARTTTGVTSRTTTVTLGTITTSSVGAGRVTLFAAPASAHPNIDWTNYNPLAECSTSAVAGSNVATFKIKRNGTTIYTDERDYSPSGGTVTFFNNFHYLYDTPGAGVTATYTFEVQTTTPSLTNHAHWVADINYLLMESKK